MSDGPPRTFNDTLSRVPTVLRLVATVVFAIVLSSELWMLRGPVVGIIAFAVYGALMAGAAFNFEGMKRWSRQHPALDASIIVPVTFLSLCLFDIPLVVCAAIGMAAGAVLVPLVVWRRGRKPPRDRSLTSIPG